jgi:hypothetical protein
MSSVSTNTMSFWACLFMVMASTTAVIVMDDEEEEEENAFIPVDAIVQALPCLRRLRKRLTSPETALQRKKPRLFDYERAHLCIQQDYFGPEPLFGHYFERVFRVARGIVEKLLQVAGTSSPFFTLQHNNVTGKEGIRPEAKVLIALKQMAFGTAAIAFTDYFQMSDTTARNSMKELCNIISASPELRGKSPIDMHAIQASNAARNAELNLMHST